MAVENVKLNSGDNLSEVAYNMAVNLWKNTHDESPALDNKDAFLDLVQECAKSLNPYGSRPSPTR
jgi:hypothetical protein